MLDVPIAIRFAKDLLTPAILATDAEGNQLVKPDSSLDHVDITLAKITLTADFDGSFGIDAEGGIDLPLCLIGDTGVGIEARGIRFVGVIDPPPPGKPIGWSGIHIPSAGLWLPGELGSIVGHLTLTDATIGNGGFSGTVASNWAPALAASVGSMELQLQSVALAFVQNSFTQCEIHGRMTLPFFEAPLDVELGINLDGSFAVKLAGENGLLTLVKPGILELQVESLAFARTGDTFTALLSGKIKPLVAGLDWPSFDVRELSIDSDGNVKLEGGWLDLRDGYSLDFHGFKVEISKMGFGKNEDGSKWIGFSGALNLVDGLAAGASVEGLKVTWYEDGSQDPKITLEGVGVELLVPNAVSFKGRVAYREFVDANGATVHQFDGDIKLQLLAINLEVDAVLVIGSALKPDGHSHTFFAIYLAAELPAGIPLWSTGLALYGLAGLFALQMEPDKLTDEEWYGVGPNDGWFKRPQIGVTDLAQKWRNQEGSLALGGGLTIGTVADNGFTFSGRMLLVLVFPGPILMIEGRASLLKERSKMTEEAIFRALAVLDGRAGTLLFGLDAQYKVGSGGELLDIRGSVEAFFDFHDQNRWHLYLGLQEPRDKRIRAQLFNLFESNAYFMLDANSLRTGAWVGYDKKWRYGPVKITLEAWLETNVMVNRKPIHFHGDLWAHGKVGMKVFGFGFGLSLDASLAGDVFDPFHILAELSVKLDLPWPIPNVNVDFSLEWGPVPTPPRIPMVLKEVAVEHLKVTTSWPLPRESLLLPNYDQNGFIGPPVGPSVPTDLSTIPVVPLDGRPHITFGRPVHDAALIGTNPQPPNPATERIGDPASNQGPAQVKYILRAVTLERLSGGVWLEVARKGDTPNVPGVRELFGSWAPVPAEFGGSANASVGQVKLWLWSKNPFDYTRVTSGAWDEWFTDNYPFYPCIPEAPGKHVCCDFTRYRIGAAVDLPHACDPEMLLLCFPPNLVRVERLRPSAGGIDRVACFQAESFLQVRFTRPAIHVDIELQSASQEVSAIADFADGTQSAPFPPIDDRLVIHHEGIVAVTVRRGAFCVIRVCADFGPDPQDVLDRQEMLQHLQESMALWSQVGAVLEPNTIYRMKILTRAEAIGEGELAGWTNNLEQEEIAYFRTEGAPGLAALSVPVGHPNSDQFDSGLDDLARYVKQTVPATVPSSGKKPLLPKPVYRAYDVGAEFNEDYVDLMYRIAGRDLGLYLFDSNNAPLRDAAGRLIVRQNEWGHAETTSFDATEVRWVQVVNQSTCAVIDESTIPKDVKLSAGAIGQVLESDMVHEARLIPLLVHESFTGLEVGTQANGPNGTMGRWQIVDQGVTQGPSSWQIAETPAPAMRYVVQTTNIWGGTTDGTDPIKPGTMLIWGSDLNLPVSHPDQPANWTDYRVTAFVRNEDDDALGLVFRYVDASNFYRFSMDAERKYRRLVRVINGIHTILDEDDRRYQPNVDYALSIEAIGASLKVYIDGDLVLEATDPSHAAGGIGLYCWASEMARFFDIKVDDFRNGLSTYRFPFTTSKFAHFTHHVQSYDDITYVGSVAPDAPVSDWVSAASPSNGPLTQSEARAYDALSHAVLGTAADGFPNALEVTRVGQNGNTIGFLVQTSEPFDWSRVDLELLAAETSAPMLILAPDILKIVAASFATGLSSEEAVHLVTRGDLDLRGYSIESFGLPGPIKGSVAKEYLFEDFAEEGHGILFEETFGPNALDRYTIVDQGDILGPSAWSVSGGVIRQTSNIAGGILAAGDLPKPGTMAITGNPEWASIRIRCRLLSTDNDAIGLVFRYRDEKNYYRFSSDNERAYRRLVKCENGIFTRLWEDASPYTPQVPFDLEIYLYRNQLVGLMDHEVVFDVIDDASKMGQVGLYSWLNTGAQFQALRVEALEADPVLLKPNVTSLDKWIVLDPDEAIDAPSAWTADASGIHQGTHIRVEGPERIGTHLVTGSQWDDFQLSVDLASSEGDAMGVLIRYQDKQNYYRFSMHRDEGVQRLVKCVNGAVTTLWQSAGGYDLDRTYRLSLQIQGAAVRGYLDGQEIFSVVDTDVPKGGVGLYTWNNGGATFKGIWILSLANYVGSFRVFDGQGVFGESVWRTRFGELQQRAPMGDANAPSLGTHAVAPRDLPVVMRLIVDARSDSDRPLGVLFRYRDERNYYRFSVSTVDHVRMLVKMIDGVATTLWQAPGGYSPGNDHRFTVDTFGSRLVGYFDGERQFELSDDSLSAGKVGVYVSRNDTASFGCVQACEPPIEAYALFTDRFLDNDFSDWTFVSEATLGGPAHWSIVDGVLRQTSAAFHPPSSSTDVAMHGLFAITGDPAWRNTVLRVRLQSDDSHGIGVMFRYQDQDHYYRFSMDRLLSYRRLVKNVGGAFTVLWEDNVPFEIGRSFEVVIVAAGVQLWGYLDGVAMFAVEDGDLASGQIGLYCWQNPGAKFSGVTVLPIDAAFGEWAFKDNFPYLVVDRWAFVDVGDVDGPSDWKVEDRHLVQKSAIAGDEPWKGTFAVSDQGSRDWADYRLATSMVSATPGVMGLAVRYRDPENHYRFEIGSTTSRRLVKVISGVETELWSEAGSFNVNEAILVAVDCVGQRITCYVNGVSVCEVVDDAFSTGRVALFAFGNPGVGFDFVRVQEAGWQGYYRFEKQPTCPAGHRIRVLACSESAAPNPLANMHDVFVAGTGEQGHFHFFGSHCDLRVVDPLGRAQHTRSFFRSSRYAPVQDVKVLRRADGCGFFLAQASTVPEGSRFERAEYRVKLTYRLDNTAVDPDSQIQREAGRSDPESTRIDLPW